MLLKVIGINFVLLSLSLSLSLSCSVFGRSVLRFCSVLSFCYICVKLNVFIQSLGTDDIYQE